VSVDSGATWDPANDAPGPEATAGQEVQFKFVVENTGNVTLKNLELDDNKLTLFSLDLPDKLSPEDDAFVFILEDVTAEDGQQKNTVTASGKYDNVAYEDTDDAHYIGETPEVGAAIRVKKYVPVDGGENWDPADEETGPMAVVG